MAPIVYSESGLYMSWHRLDGTVANGWFYSGLDLVRWLRLCGQDVRDIIVLRVG